MATRHPFLHVCLCHGYRGNSLPLDLLVVALPAELLNVLFAEALLSLRLLLEDLYGLVERLDGRSLHLDLLRGEEVKRRRRKINDKKKKPHTVRWRTGRRDKLNYKERKMGRVKVRLLYQRLTETQY